MADDPFIVTEVGQTDQRLNIVPAAEADRRLNMASAAQHSRGGSTRLRSSTQ